MESSPCSLAWLHGLLPDQAFSPVVLVAVSTLIGLYLAEFGLGMIRSYLRRSEYRRKRTRKRNACKKSIEDLTSRVRADPLIPTEEIDRITGLSLEELRQELKASRITPLEALRAFQTKAIEAHAKTNCLTEAVIEAEEWAAELGKKPKDGLLYGVPVSIKDDVAAMGYDTSMGCAKLVEVPARGDCALLKVLKSQGAVPFVRTNVPQMEISYEPGNPINGLVFNPHNLKHGPGGSSSGEAALIASGACVLGTGSDIGGSLRIPAHFCGVCSLKPTSTRMSNLGVMDSLPATQITIIPTFGHLARDVDSVVLGFKAVWSDNRLADLDPKVVRMPFNEQVYTGERRLRIGYHTDNGVFAVTPGCARAVDMAKSALEGQGHELVYWRPEGGLEGKELGLKVLHADAGRYFTDILTDDEVDPTIKFITQFLNLPRWIRKLLAAVLRPMAPNLASVADASLGVTKTVDYLDLNKTVNEYIQRVHDSWTENKLDALICPPFPIAAPPIPNADLCFEGVSYPFLYNILDLPSGVVPMTTVTSSDIEKLRDYPTGDWGQRAAKKATQESKGMPVGIMVTAQRYQDELCLRVMKELEPYADKVKVT